MKCDRCNEKISKKIVRADGLPNGLTFVRKEGEPITLCTNCILDLGKAEDKEKFFKDLGV